MKIRIYVLNLLVWENKFIERYVYKCVIYRLSLIKYEENSVRSCIQYIKDTTIQNSEVNNV
jgi:hypothetical protein